MAFKPKHIRKKMPTKNKTKLMATSLEDLIWQECNIFLKEFDEMDFKNIDGLLANHLADYFRKVRTITMDVMDGCYHLDQETLKEYLKHCDETMKFLEKLSNRK